MLKGIRAAFAAAIVLVASTGIANAAIITDPTLYEDLSVDVVNNLSGFNIAGPASGPATLSLRFGQWNGAAAVLDLAFTFNGTELLPYANSTGAYFTNPASIVYDVSSLVTSGLNTLSVFGTLVSGGPVTFAVGEATLEYSATSVPEPTALTLLIFGLAGIAYARKQKLS